MPIEIRVGAPNITIHHDRSVLVTEPDGCMRQPSQKGLYYLDTRLISGIEITGNGKKWQLLSWGNEAYNSARIVLANAVMNTTGGPIKKHSLGLTISRTLDSTMREDMSITNYGERAARFRLQLEITSDFADLFEVKRGERSHRTGIKSDWSEEQQTLSHRYWNEDFFRGVSITILECSANPSFANGKIYFPIDIEPGGHWRARLVYEFSAGDDAFSRRRLASTNPSETKRCKPSTVSSSWSDFNRIARQAAEDAVALRLTAPDNSQDIIPAAGVPWFLTLFGRDSIIASLQYQLIDANFARGALDLLASMQADRIDDFRDAEPGKIPHEMRHGELAHFNKIPHNPYYGTADATPLYLILLHAAWKRTGDRSLLEKHLATAENCLAWINDYGDRDGDGFQEYEKRSPRGYENQSWKDAQDAILYPDGSCVKGPKALCELQGYVFDAWLKMAEVFDELGSKGKAKELRRKADELYRRFNETFWCEEAGFYALALDGDKTPVMSVASNPGHCLWSGIVPNDRARKVVDRLLQADMWSGWGIRTLSSRHPGFNPYAYQVGAVWPHDNSIIALGMKRYGFHAEANKIVRAVCEAGSFFVSNRLPELFAGVDRRETGFPIRYIGANVPQAWASGAIYAFVQAMIGFLPNIPRGILELDPSLPDWLPELKIENLRLGDRKVDLRFWREGEQTLFKVVRGDCSQIFRRETTTKG
jgi:glycogen debranching enzyme